MDGWLDGLDGWLSGFKIKIIMSYDARLTQTHIFAVLAGLAVLASLAGLIG
jgi:hypothetical protein